jgi:hypothetical protein
MPRQAVGSEESWDCSPLTVMSHGPNSKDAIRGPIPSAICFLCLQIGIWQGCQLSRLFHEDAQGAQVINLSILPGWPAGINPPERGSPAVGTQHQAPPCDRLGIRNLVLSPTVIRSGAAVHEPGEESCGGAGSKLVITPYCSRRTK